MKHRIHRWRIAGLLVLATAGGYLLTAMATSILALLLARTGISGRADAVLLSSLLSFAVYTGIVIRIFSSPSARRAWADTGTSLLALGVVLAALRACS
jgi:hypothetical protein